MRLNFSMIALMFCILAPYAQTTETLYLWPGKVPGETKPKNEPAQQQDPPDDVTRLTEVTNPALIVFEPDASVRNGAGVIVCPGGGYSILAIDLEGYEIAQWLNKLGLTAFVLQYRVPGKQDGALNDIQRAVRVVRSRAGIWNLDPGKIGVMGFSAGGSLCARASTRYTIRTYDGTDPADTLSCRPDFSLLIYPAYLDQGENRSLTPELLADHNSPPVFIFATADDRYSNSALVMATACRDSGIPVELHLLPYGGHGYGLRQGNVAAETWPRLAEIWLKNIIAANDSNKN